MVGGKGKETAVAVALCSSQTQLVFEPTAGSNLMVSGGKGGGMAKVRGETEGILGTAIAAWQ